MYHYTVIAGRLGRDPEMRYTPQGKAVVTFSVAVDTFRGSGEAQPTWYRVTAWEKAAEACNAYLHKGDLVLCEGEAAVSAYMGKDGQPRASLELRARSVKFLEKRRDGAAVANVTEDEAIPF
jgi:single-strand DNA-binding protein